MVGLYVRVALVALHALLDPTSSGTAGSGRSPLHRSAHPIYSAAARSAPHQA